MLTENETLFTVIIREFLAGLKDGFEIKALTQKRIIKSRWNMISTLLNIKELKAIGNHSCEKLQCKWEIIDNYLKSNIKRLDFQLERDAPEAFEYLKEMHQ